MPTSNWVTFASIVVPNATHVESATRDVFSELTESHRVVVVGEESLTRDVYDNQLAAGPVAGATVLSASQDRASLREDLASHAEAVTDGPVVRVVDAETGEYTRDLEYRSVEYEGTRLLSVTNVTDEAKQISITVDGSTVDPDREVLEGLTVSGPTIDLPAYTPTLFELE
jgi:hypothetical protein